MEVFEVDANHSFECRMCKQSKTAGAFTRKQRRRPAAERVCIECTGEQPLTLTLTLTLTITLTLTGDQP